MDQNIPPPIIIKRINSDEHSVHGGAWKIALADMMTAMMAFFLVLWLISSTSSENLSSIAQYFKPQDKMLGSEGEIATTKKLSSGTAMSVFVSEPNKIVSDRMAENRTNIEKDEDEEVSKLDDNNFTELERKLTEMVSKDPDQKSMLDQINFVREQDGLRIEIVDRENASMFAIGTSVLLPRARELMEKVAFTIQKLPNKIVLRGHTDSHAYKRGDVRNNWLLSTERSDSTRIILESNGVKSERFLKIEGVADTAPFMADDPYDPRNRRINIILRYQSVRS